MVKLVDQGLIDQGLTLMLVGMGTVFVFLTTLVFTMMTMSVLVRRFEPTPTIEATEEEVAAISAAIAAHRRK